VHDRGVAKATEERAMRNLTIDGSRLWDSLMEMARIGATPKGGVCRLALTDLDREGRELFMSWCRAAGCTISMDRVGNIFARRPGRDPARKPVMTGSHLDTQPTGGRFDGIFGVLAGLEVIRTLNDRGIETEAPVEVAVWTNEEGSRFSPAMMGSGVHAGVFPLAEILDKRDMEGRRFGDELARIGHAGPDEPGARQVGAYFEAHIEQGPILEAEGTTIGVVTGSQGQRWFEVTVKGQEAHAGPTPMSRRRRAHDRPRQPHRARAPAARLRDGRGDPVEAELAQHHPRRGVLHGRFPPSRRRGALDDGGAAQERMPRHRRGGWARGRDRRFLVRAADALRGAPGRRGARRRAAPRLLPPRHRLRRGV